MGAKPETIDMVPPVEVAIGPERSVRRLTDKALQVAGTFSATLQLEGTINGSTWEDVGVAITAPGIVVVAGTFEKLRINVTVFVSGVPTALLAGLKQTG